VLKLGGDATLLKTFVPDWQPKRLRETLAWMIEAAQQDFAASSGAVGSGAGVTGGLGATAPSANGLGLPASNASTASAQSFPPIQP